MGAMETTNLVEGQAGIPQLDVAILAFPVVANDDAESAITEEMPKCKDKQRKNELAQLTLERVNRKRPTHEVQLLRDVLGQQLPPKRPSEGLFLAKLWLGCQEVFIPLV